MTAAVDVVIVNWNAGSLLRECVDSVLAHGPPYVAATIVVDNDSTDGSAGTVEGLNGITLVHAGRNLGFSKACNLGAGRGHAEYVLFLNPDARLLAGSLASVLGFMSRPDSSKIGICGIQLVGEDGRVSRNCARFPTLGGILARSAGLDRVAPRFSHFETEWDHGTTREVDQVMGAFFLVRRALFDSLGGFDERFFVYFEDVDLAFRARKAGWSSVYFAGARAFHLGGGTSNQVKAHRLFYVLRGRILYTYKHFDTYAATAALAATLLVEPFARSFLAMRRRSLTSLQETWRAYGMLFRWLPSAAKKARARTF